MWCSGLGLSQVVLEDSREDLKVVHISRLKPCYPRAQDLEVQERWTILDIFKEKSDEEDFLGFPDNSFSTSSRG